MLSRIRDSIATVSPAEFTNERHNFWTMRIELPGNHSDRRRLASTRPSCKHGNGVSINLIYVVLSVCLPPPYIVCISCKRVLQRGAMMGDA